jgi:hypothetical protein
MLREEPNYAAVIPSVSWSQLESPPQPEGKIASLTESLRNEIVDITPTDVINYRLLWNDPDTISLFNSIQEVDLPMIHINRFKWDLNTFVLMINDI